MTMMVRERGAVKHKESRQPITIYLLLMIIGQTNLKLIGNNLIKLYYYSVDPPQDILYYTYEFAISFTSQRMLMELMADLE